MLQDPLHRGGRGLLDGRVKLLTVGRGVIEAELGRKDVVSKIIETCVVGGPGSELIHLIEQSGQLAATFDVGCACRPEGSLPHRLVRTLQEWLKLGERPL